MNKDTALYQMNLIIHNQTAWEFAEHQLAKEKENPVLLVGNMSTGTLQTTERKVSYLEYMRETWGNETDTLKDCIVRSRNSKLQQYAKIIEVYTGWINNGCKYVFDVREGIIYALFNVDLGGTLAGEPRKVELYTNYNPFNHDCTEASMGYTVYKKALEKGDMIEGTNEDKLIKVLHEIFPYYE